MLKLSFFLSLLFLLASCNNANNTPTEQIQEVFYKEAPVQVTHFELFVQLNDHRASVFEPSFGIFAGIYLRQDNTTSSIRSFEQSLGVQHAIYAYSITLGQAYPIMFVLEAIANNKTPLITVIPSHYNIFDISLIYDLAHEVGRFNVPIFLQFYPITNDFAVLPSEYISFFIEAVQVFRRYAPNIAIIWGFDSHNITTASHFWPGQEFVDWINLTIYADVDIYGQHNDIFAYIDLFSLNFQRQAPLMLTLGVSHHNFENNRYFVSQAAEKLYNIYTNLELYPRIMAIIYQNYSTTDHEKNSGQNYKVNTSDIIQNAYASAISNPHFITNIEKESQSHQNTFVSSAFQAIEYNGNFFIPYKALIYDLQIDDIGIFNNITTEIENTLFVSISDINRILYIDFFINRQNNMLFLFYN